MTPFEADIVVIGGGSAGCVVAARLSQDPTLQVLLLEAGEKGSTVLGNTPGMTIMLMGNPKTDWLHMAAPDPTLQQRTPNWNAGKMLGGGSSINGMVYIRGLRRDYDEWARLGCTGWGWDDVVPFFRRAEHFEDNSQPSLGTSGPLDVSRIRSLHCLTERFVDACEHTGIPRVEDYNQGEREGAFVNLTNQYKGRRASTARNYLVPALKRPNLRVVRNALVDRVLFNGDRACAVRFRLGNEVHEAKVRREVVVSGGTIQSPAILMRSGIGPAAELRQLGIAVVADRPGVGSNLQDHSAVMVTKFVNVPTYNSQMDPVNGLKQLCNYLLFRKGPLASAAVQGMAWVRSQADLVEPDLHLNWFPYAVDYAVAPPAMHKQAGVGIGACVSRPHSRGAIRLRSANAADKPLIDHRVYGDERDLQAALRGVRLIERIFEAPALAQAVTGASAPMDRPMDDATLTETIRAYTGMGLHSVGTCRMGSDDDAVVDTELRVRGVRGLRVIDASIMPRQISANTNAASIMIGEKGAEHLQRTMLAPRG